MSILEPKEPVERPRVELVEEIPSGEAEARRAFYAGAVASGLLCAIAFIETIEEDSMAILIVLRGSATVTRQRAGAQVGLHLTPRCGQPVWLTSPGTYCVVAKDHVVGVRMLRSGAT